MAVRFSSSQVIAITGITPRQLQWWDERGLIVPAREGRNRLYSIDDIAEVAVLCQLRRKGFSLQRVRKIMRYLQRELGKRLIETVTAGSDYHLLTDGKRIYLENSDREVVDILKNASQPLFGICLTDAVREIHAEIRTQRVGEHMPELVRPASRKTVKAPSGKPGQTALLASTQATAAKRRAIS